MPSGAGLGGPVSDPVMQVTLSNSGTNVTTKLHILSFTVQYACTVQYYACVVCRFGHMSHIYGHSHSMGTSVNVVIQEIAIKSGLLLIIYSH